MHQPSLVDLVLLPTQTNTQAPMYRQIKSMATFLHIRKCCTVGGQCRSPPTHRIYNCKHFLPSLSLFLTHSLLFTWSQLHLHMYLWPSTTWMCTPTYVDSTSKHTLTIPVISKHILIGATQKNSKMHAGFMNEPRDGFRQHFFFFIWLGVLSF